MSHTTPLMTVTDKAREHIQRMLEHRPDADAFRLAVRSNGCSGLSYDPALVAEGQKNDLIFEQDGLTVYIDANSQHALQDVTVDYQKNASGLGHRLVFHNPHAVHTCGCGESFNIKKRASTDE